MKEKTKTGTRKSLLYSGLHTLGTNFIATPLMVVGGILIARALGPAGKGSYDLVLATTNLLDVLLGFYLPAGVIYIVARGDAAPGSLALRLLLLAPCQGLAAVILLYFLQYTKFSSALLPPYIAGEAIAAIGIALLFTEFINFWRAILVGLQEIIKVNHLELLNRIIFLFLLIAVIGILYVRQYPASATIFIWLHVVSLIFVSLIFSFALSPFLSYGKSALREVAAFAFPCYLANVSQFLNYRFDIFMVSFFVGVEGVGLYALAVNLGQMIWLVSQSAAHVLLPKIAASQKESADENTYGTARITRITLLVSFLLAFFLAIIAYPMLPLVYGKAFRRSIAPFLFLLPGIVAFSTVFVLASYISGIGKPKINLIISLAGLFFTIILDFLLIPRFNIIGAAMASTVSYSTSALLTIWFFRHQSSIPLRDILLINSEDWGLVIRWLRPIANRFWFLLHNLFH